MKKIVSTVKLKKPRQKTQEEILHHGIMISIKTHATSANPITEFCADGCVNEEGKISSIGAVYQQALYRKNHPELTLFSFSFICEHRWISDKESQIQLVRLKISEDAPEKCGDALHNLGGALNNKWKGSGEKQDIILTRYF